MVKQISDYTVNELSAKIEAIKAERERTAETLKKYEEELECKKQEIPLGVPIINVSQYKTLYWLNGSGLSWEEKASLSSDIQLRQWSFLNVFHSKESAEKHAEMLLAWRRALVANAKGEQIDIKVLLPLLPKGWVAMDENGDWFWHKEKPEVRGGSWAISSRYYYIPPCFRLKPADDWRESLMECGL